MRNCNTHKKNNSGFTLTEIVVVMVLLGLIIVLATSITLIVDRSQKISQLDSKDENEILKLETAFKDWLMLYDSTSHTLILSEKRITVPDSSIEDPIQFEISLDENSLLLTYTENVGDDAKPFKTIITFTSIENITFNICETDIICCTATFKNTGFEYKILHHIRASKLQQN